MQSRNRWYQGAVALLLCVCLTQVAAYKSCGGGESAPKTARTKTVEWIDRSGNAIDHLVADTDALEQHGKISTTLALKVVGQLKTANRVSLRAGERVLAWITQVDAARQAAKDRGEVFAEPAEVPESVKGDVRRILDELKGILSDIAGVTDNEWVKALAAIVAMVDKFYQLVT